MRKALIQTVATAFVLALSGGSASAQVQLAPS